MKLNLHIAILLACSSCAWAQQPPAVEETISRLVAYSKDYRSKLPSLECDESIVSQQVKGGKVKWEVKIEATLRQVRDSKDTDEFNDSYTFKTVDGHPPKARFKLPYLVNRAFANGIDFTFDDGQKCFAHILSTQDSGATLRLEFVARSASSAPACKDVIAGFHEIVLIDAGTGIVKQVTRNMPPETAHKYHEPVYASIDYAPQQLGDLTLWLPSRLESHDEKSERRMTAIFSNYHRYTGEARMLPGIQELPSSDASNP